MVNQKYFCNSPWFHLQIYHDGGFGFCCTGTNRGYTTEKNSKYNIRNMSISEWYNSEPMRNIRLSHMQGKKISGCEVCYNDEQYDNHSYRLSANWRSIIFTKNAFEKSFVQSPHYDKFKQSEVDGFCSTLPVDLHIDLGNECNLACKFCSPHASSKIGNKYKSWGLLDVNSVTRIDWTSDQPTWIKFCTELLKFDNLRSVHFMGGEPMMSPRVEDFLDFFIENNKTNFAISFVTNGTIYKQTVVDKMKKFQRADIDVSIESVLDNNFYIRQNLDSKKFKENVQKFLDQRDDKLSICLKPVICLLSAPTFPELIRYFYENNIITESNVCYEPAYLQVNVLPKKIRELYIPKFEQLLEELSYSIKDDNKDNVQSRFYERNAVSLYSELKSVYNMLLAPDHENAEALRGELVHWLTRWDNEYDLDARDLYPEWAEFLQDYGYKKF